MFDLLQLHDKASFASGLLGPPTGQASDLPLHSAAASGDVQLLRAALRLLPGQLNERDGRGRTPLHCAIDCQQHGCLRELLAASADTELAYRDGATPLRSAASKALPWAVRELLEAGAKMDAANKQGQTALHMAALGGQEPWPSEERDLTACIHLLLAAGANACAKDSGGRTPLDSARQGGRQGCLEALQAAASGKRGSFNPNADLGRAPILPPVYATPLQVCLCRLLWMLGFAGQHQLLFAAAACQSPVARLRERLPIGRWTLLEYGASVHSQLQCLQPSKHPLTSDYLLFPMVETERMLEDPAPAHSFASLLLVCPAGKVLLHFDSQVRPGSLHGSSYASAWRQRAGAAS